MVNLSGNLRSMKTQDVIYQMITKSDPVDIRVGNVMGIEISGGPAEFC